MSKQVWISIAFGLALLPRAAGAQTASGRDARFDDARAFILQTMAERKLPSVAVAVAEHGKIVWEEGFGWADMEKRIPATEHTTYSMASISKPFTATGLMRLVQDGRVKLDEPVNTYLGLGKIRGLAGSADGATVRRVLSHTAGLPLHYQFFYEGEGYDPPTMDETIARYGILVSAPGEVYSYSNLGFGILDHVIARVSGRDYADFMRTEVFIPLGLTRTSVDVTPELEPYAAMRYDLDGKRPVARYDFDHRGASAVYSSAHDLVRFGMFHMGDRLPDQVQILTDETRKSMWEVQTPPPGSAGYALGWRVNPDDRGHRSVSHTGGMPGVSTQLVLYPDEDVAVVVLLNTRDASLSRIIEKVTDAVLPGYAAARPPAAPTPAAAPPPDLGPLRGKWEGTLRTWQDSIPVALEVQPDGDVHVRIKGQFETLLDEVTFRDGALAGGLAAEIFTPDAQRKRHSITLALLQHGDTLRGSASAQNSWYYALTSYMEVIRRR